jgi:predicted RNA binding protein YcfA (HicA-like mRNA interferase family)
MAGEVHFKVVKRLLNLAGYEHVRTASSHFIFEKPGKSLLSIPVHKNKVKPVYVRQIKKIIAEDQES